MDAEKLIAGIYERGEISKEEAIERARLIFDLLKRIPDLDLSDCWIGLSDNWDLNIYNDVDDVYDPLNTKMILYVVNNQCTNTSDAINGIVQVTP